MRKYIIIFCLTIICLIACNSSKPSGNSDISDCVAESWVMNYSSHLRIFKTHSSNYLVQIHNPWDTSKILHSYLLVYKNSKTEIPYNEDCTIIRIPLDNVLVFTSLHSHLINELGNVSFIKGVCDAEYILDDGIKKLVAESKIQNCGSSMSPDIEKIISLKPEAIFLSPYENSNGYGLLSKADVPLIECADYMESSPLAQAEWIKFYGLLFNKLDVADSIFSAVETSYNSLKKSLTDIQNRPKLLANIMMGNTWYVPTKNSTSGRFYLDAGTKYPFDYLESFGAVPLDFETVFSKANDADIWVFKYNSDNDFTLETLSAENPNYKNFKALKDGNVYGCNLNYSPYYDEVPFHPDLLLKDLVKIAHPEMLSDYQLRYYTKLK